MENKQIVFNFNMFDAGQKIFIVDTESGKATASYAIDRVEDAADVIASACIDTKISKLHLFGEEKYLNDYLIPHIEKNLQLAHYNADVLEIEVN